MRGAEGRRAIGIIVDTFGKEAQHFVFIGGGVLCLYARPTGAPIRLSDDVDCVSTKEPWIVQEKTLAAMCQEGKLTPDPEVQCRYHLSGKGVALDVLSPDGYNVPSNAWLKRAAANAAPYDIGDGRKVLAITPPYFLATKLVAFEDRGRDPIESRDAQDIVALAIEVPTLREQVHAAGLTVEISQLWADVFTKYRMSTGDMADLVDAHVHRDDAAERDRAIATLTQLVEGD
jgi:hypothetical protein